ncbi:MAG: VPLPA-CTERM sorting domain-containing protein [Lentisphaeria bacterium]
MTTSHTQSAGKTNVCPRTLLSVVVLAASLLAFAPVTGHADVIQYDTFSTDPQFATAWSGYVRSIGPDGNGSLTWNSTSGDVTSTAYHIWLGLYRTGATRTATDPVTLQVNSVRDGSGDWSLIGLAITTSANPAFDAADNGYSFYIAGTNGTSWTYYVTGSGNSLLFSQTIGATVGSTKLDIIRDGDFYRFLANGTTLFSDNGVTRYGQIGADSIGNYSIQYGAGNTNYLVAVIDNYGIVPVPEPASALILLAGVGSLTLLRRRR